MQLSPANAESRIRETATLIESFLIDQANALSLANQTYLEQSLDVKDKFAHFYIVAKVHKSVEVSLTDSVVGLTNNSSLLSASNCRPILRVCSS
jgi:hypothetical protein